MRSAGPATVSGLTSDGASGAGLRLMNDPIPSEVRRPREWFRFCPNCGADVGLKEGEVAGRLRCGGCGFLYYFNPTVAAVAFAFRSDGRVLLIRRAKEPGKGMLAPPGGFIDAGERAETAVEREVREEVNVELREVRFLCSQVNTYVYGGVEYPVLDLFFTAQVLQPDTAESLDDVDGFEWRDPMGVAESELAFPSMRAALRMLKEGWVA